MRKGRESVGVWVTFIDIKSKTILLITYKTAKSGGFGFRNYWAKPFYTIRKDMGPISTSGNKSFTHNTLQKKITHTVEQDVKFSEVDSLGIVWHGHYVQYFEDGRESFGKEYKLRYLDFYANGYVLPIVSLHCDFKRSLRYGDRMSIEITYIPTLSAKLNFEYKIVNAKTNELIITGSTSQVFLSKGDLVLQLTNPQFFQDWKESLSLNI